MRNYPRHPRKGSRNKSGVVGVHYCKYKRIKQWRVLVQVNGKQTHAGYFPTKAIATDALEKAEDLAL
jgi:hypothetical protein